MSHHDHDHNHEHDHDHSHETEKTFDEKLVVLLDHWIKHNDDHARNYRDWAQKAADQQFPEVGELLNEAADMTLKISEIFVKADVLAKK